MLDFITNARNPAKLDEGLTQMRTSLYRNMKPVFKVMFPGDVDDMATDTPAAATDGEPGRRYDDHNGYPLRGEERRGLGQVPGCVDGTVPVRVRVGALHR